MIARQRANLQQAFFVTEQEVADPELVERLEDNEQKLAKATAGFVAGIDQRFEPVAALHEALQAMTSAVEALAAKEVRSGCGFEETALARLINARRNMRQMLRQSNSSSSACRRFDRQQHQRLRRQPEEEQENEHRLHEEIEKLAREQRECSKQCQSRRKSGRQPQSKTGLAGRQEEAAETATELQQKVREDAALTDLACRRMDAAAAAIHTGVRSLRDERYGQAGRQAAEAADQLARLARQVAGLKAAELAEKLEAAENLARELALQQQKQAAECRSSQHAVGSAGRRAARQHGQAAEARTLADFLNQFPLDAAQRDLDLGRTLRQAAESNSPAEVARRMERAADALETGSSDLARREMETSAEKLDALAEDLDAMRRALVQPRLEMLMAAEKQAAALEERLSSASEEGQKGEIEKDMTELRDTMQSLSTGYQSLRDATDSLVDAMRPAGSNNVRRDVGSGWYEPPQRYQSAVQRVVRDLQATIHDAILKSMPLDADEPVPAQYKEYVETYYRVLSEDLR